MATQLLFSIVATLAAAAAVIAGGRVPQFAPGVTNALRAELDALRTERADAARAAIAKATGGNA